MRRARVPAARPARREDADGAVSSWWGLKWLALLSAFGWSSRLAAGRADAREGRVSSLAVSAGEARAEVQGAAPAPYEVRIGLKPLPEAVLAKAIRAMAAKASFAAGLLAGRIPEDVEEAFAGTGRTLLPTSPDELSHRSTCDDETPFCRHVAAAHFALAERLDRDPFLVFRLRGVSREALLERLQAARAELASPPPGGGAVSREAPRAPLPDVKPESFYKPLRPLASLRAAYVPPEPAEALLARLGPPPFENPEAARLLEDFLLAIGHGAKERLTEWEWRRVLRPR